MTHVAPCISLEMAQIRKNTDAKNLGGVVVAMNSKNAAIQMQHVPSASSAISHAAFLLAPHPAERLAKRLAKHPAAHPKRTLPRYLLVARKVTLLVARKVILPVTRKVTPAVILPVTPAVAPAVTRAVARAVTLAVTPAVALPPKKCPLTTKKNYVCMTPAAQKQEYTIYTR